jgi:hypothetical protein
MRTTKARTPRISTMGSYGVIALSRTSHEVGRDLPLRYSPRTIPLRDSHWHRGTYAGRLVGYTLLERSDAARTASADISEPRIANAYAAIPCARPASTRVRHSSRRPFDVCHEERPNPAAVFSANQVMSAAEGNEVVLGRLALLAHRVTSSDVVELYRSEAWAVQSDAWPYAASIPVQDATTDSPRDYRPRRRSQLGVPPHGVGSASRNGWNGTSRFQQ